MFSAMVYALVIVAGSAVRVPPGVVGEQVSPAARCEALSANLRISPRLRPVVIDMCRRAPTFRRQVVRLAHQQGLVVTVEPGFFPITGRAQATTDIRRVNGGLRTAEVRVPGGDSLQVVELLGHEFEHILEQLDGVDLSKWVGRSGVRRVSDGSGPVETERARQVGRLVAGEYAAAGAETTAFKVR